MLNELANYTNKKSEYEYLYQEGLIESIGKLSFHNLFSLNLYIYIPYYMSYCTDKMAVIAGYYCSLT